MLIEGKPGGEDHERIRHGNGKHERDRHMQGDTLGEQTPDDRHGRAIADRKRDTRDARQKDAEKLVAGHQPGQGVFRDVEMDHRGQEASHQRNGNASTTRLKRDGGESLDRGKVVAQEHVLDEQQQDPAQRKGEERQQPNVERSRAWQGFHARVRVKNTGEGGLCPVKKQLVACREACALS